jgi:hypothetical protein
MSLVRFAKYSVLAAGVALGGLTGGIATAGSAAAQGWGGQGGGWHDGGGRGDRDGFRDHRGGGWDRGRDWRPRRPPGFGFGPPRGPRCTIQYRVVPSPYGPVRRPFRVCF